MTDAELRELAQIERQLVAESPELRRMFGDDPGRRRRRRTWARAGVLVALSSLILLVCGLSLGVTALAVTALCPPLTYGVLLLGELLLRADAVSRRPGRSR